MNRVSTKNVCSLRTLSDSGLCRDIADTAVEEEMVRTAPTLPALNRVVATGSYGSKNFPGSKLPDEHGAWAGRWNLSSIAESFIPDLPL